MSKPIYHYVYRATNILINKHYYGARTCKNCLPIDDIGVKYLSSSTDLDFIKDQKLNPSHYKYKIVGVYKTRKRAIEIEGKLQKKYRVNINESFYNKAVQTSTGFDTAGMVTSRNIKTGETSNVPREEFLLNPSLVHICAGTRHSQETKDKMRESHIGIIPSQETKDKMRESRIGTKHSQETMDKMRESKIGEKNPKFAGYYHVPQFGKFASSYALEHKGIDNVTTIKYCKKNNTVISKMTYTRSKFLQTHFSPDIIGKTFKDLGFWFEKSIEQ